LGEVDVLGPLERNVLLLWRNPDQFGLIESIELGSRPSDLRVKVVVGCSKEATVGRRVDGLGLDRLDKFVQDGSAFLLADGIRFSDELILPIIDVP
jgi:hypothetical protein